MAIEVIQSKIGNIKVTDVVEDGNGGWKMDGEITFAVESRPSTDLNVTIALEFSGVRTPVEAMRQALMNLQLIASQFSELAARELQTLNRRIASQR